MFGTYRFILSLLVVAEHSGINRNEHFDLISPDYHVGASAVVGFYVLSGYVMAHSFSINFNRDIKRTLSFYFDRFLRIYPVYIFFFFAIVTFMFLTGFAYIDINFNNLISNITIIPLNILIFYSTGETYNIFPANAVPFGLSFPVPIAPSLALWIQFYLVFPFLIYYRKLLYSIYPISLMLFIFAALGFIPWWHGYLLLPGTLFIFLSGTFLYEYKCRIGLKKGRNYLIYSNVLLFFLLLYVVYADRKLGHILEVIIGFECSLAAVYFLSEIKGKYSLDLLLGGLSYPIFLCANFTKLLPSYYFKHYGEYSLLEKNLYQIIAIMLVSAFAYYLIDYNTQKIRKKIQKI